MTRRYVTFTLALLTARALQAQTPAGPEFRVNTYTTGNPSWPALAVDPSGGFVAAWDDASDGSDSGVVARRFAANGAPLGDELRLNEYTTGAQLAVSVSADGKGGFVAAWLDAERNQMRGRLFDRTGQPRTGELLLKDGSRVPHVAGAADGSFVVVWYEFAVPNNTLIKGQRFDANGSPRGAEFLANTFSNGFLADPAVASAPDGRFVVAWTGDDGYMYGVRARRFASSGAALGDEFQVNTYTTGYQFWFGGKRDRVMAVAPDGGFVVTWESGPGQGNKDVMAQRFGPAGQRLGGEFRVNSATADGYPEPRIAMDDSGDFVVAWHGQGQGGQTDVFARRYDASGNARGPEVRVNTTTTGSQLFPMVDSDPAGNLVVAWANFPQGPDGSVISAQRFGGLQPAALTVDATGNGVLEPGETAVMAPFWRNVNGLPQAFTGTLTGLTGPAGGTYVINDATADYGTVTNGAAASCGSDCYALSVTGMRPALHWDATATEAIAPDSQGQRKSWLLHLGDSFADVPRSSPFYRFVETLLHRGVTGGCASTTYCPTAEATREQMAVFVLAAKEGAGYAPPACTTPVFGDVPASSPFCRWIEELARRGVVSGCGGGNYCPASPVSREQMAVFTLHTLDPALNPPGCTTPMFNDVPASSPFCRWIEELARRGVVSGCGGGSYCPSAALTREQMSVFLTATFGLTLYES